MVEPNFSHSANSNSRWFNLFGKQIISFKKYIDNVNEKYCLPY